MKGHYETVDEAEDEYGLSVDSYLGEPNVHIEEETELQSSSDVLNVIDHLGQSQLVDMNSRHLVESLIKITCF